MRTDDLVALSYISIAAATSTALTVALLLSAGVATPMASEPRPTSVPPSLIFRVAPVSPVIDFAIIRDVDAPMARLRDSR